MKSFPSTLVVADNLAAIDDLLTGLGHHSILNNPDIFLVSDYTIESIRSINSFLSRTPVNHNTKIIVIPEAHRLNLESQNCLLKNLEEPGENNYFILQTSKPNSLLSTVLSRCHLIRAKSTSPSAYPILRPAATLAANLNLVDSLGITKETIIPYLEAQQTLYHRELVHHPTKENSQFLAKIFKALSMADSNIDPKNVLDYLLLSYFYRIRSNSSSLHSIPNFEAASFAASAFSALTSPKGIKVNPPKYPSEILPGDKLLSPYLTINNRLSDFTGLTSISLIIHTTLFFCRRQACSSKVLSNHSINFYFCMTPHTYISDDYRIIPSQNQK